MGQTILDGATAKKALGRLMESYKHAHYYLNFGTDVELMVAAIISAQTRDEVVNSLTPELFKRYRAVNDYAQADEKELAGYISKVSFCDAKAKNIIKTCRIIMDKHAGRIPRSMGELLELPGIGRKTANTILINAYGIVEGIPVDTWVIKLSWRIGLSGSKRPEDIEQDLMGLADRKYWKTLAYVLKSHGKAICQSQAPLCSKCMVKDICLRNGVKQSR